MNDRELIAFLLGALGGYVSCFVVEIWNLTKEPPKSPPPQPKDPADWWKDIQ